MAPFVDEKLKSALRSFNERGQLGPDPLAARYAERRAGYSLFSRMLSDADIEALRPYLFCYTELPPRRKLTIRNFIGGEWRAPRSGGHRPLTRSPHHRGPPLYGSPPPEAERGAPASFCSPAGKAPAGGGARP